MERGRWAAHLLRRIAREFDLPHLTIGPAAIRTLERRSWPGNVRKLRNALERAAILSQGQTIQPKHLDSDGPAVRYSPSRQAVHSPDDPRIPATLNRLDKAIVTEVLTALDESGGKVAGAGGAAVRLGLPSTTLHSLMKRLGLRRTAGL